MEKVFKYDLRIDDKVTLLLPVGAKVLTVQEQFGKACLWALVNPKAETEERVFRIAGTGHPIKYDMGVDYNYIATFQLHGGAFVGHVFEVI